MAGCGRWLAAEANNRKGEFVLVVEGCAAEHFRRTGAARALALVAKLRPGFAMKQAVALASEITGARKNALYQAVLDDEQG